LVPSDDKKHFSRLLVPEIDLTKLVALVLLMLVALVRAVTELVPGLDEANE
jgi:hypothetical protein